MQGTVIVALITAIAAIIAPLITAAIEAKSTIRVKELDLLENYTYAAVSELANSYAKFHCEPGYVAPYRGFIAATYNVMANIPSGEIQNQLTVLVDLVQRNGKRPSAETDAKFDSIMRLLSVWLSSGKDNYNYRHRKKLPKTDNPLTITHKP